MNKANSGFKQVSELLGEYKSSNEDKYLSREFQKYGYDLAETLGDMEHKSLYIKLSKETPRGLLESAKSFVMDADTARSKARLFMWKLKQLKEAQKNKK